MSCPSIPSPARRKRLASLDDAELIALARGQGAHHRQALETLLQRYRPWIHRRCRAHLGDPQDAEDVTQTVLLRICRGLDGFNGRASFRTWLTKVVDNQCWTFLKRRARYFTVEHIEDLIELHEGGRAALSLDRSIEARIDSARLLELCPHGAREVIWLRFFQGLSLEEIAATLEITLSAAKMRLYRGLDEIARASLKGPPRVHGATP